MRFIVALLLASTLLPAYSAPVNLAPGSSILYKRFSGLGTNLAALNSNPVVNAAPQSCPSQTVSWMVGGSTCYATTGVTTHNGVTMVSALPPASGNARFQCNGFTNVYQFLATEPHSCN